MAEKKYPAGFLKLGVHRQLQGSEPEWARLKKNVEDMAERIPHDVHEMAHVKRRKPLLPRKNLRRLQKLRHGHRKSYQQECKNMIQSWRPAFQNRRTMLDTLQKTRRNMWVQEVKLFKDMALMLSKLAEQLLSLRKQMRG